MRPNRLAPRPPPPAPALSDPLERLASPPPSPSPPCRSPRRALEPRRVITSPGGGVGGGSSSRHFEPDFPAFAGQLVRASGSCNLLFIDRSLSTRGWEPGGSEPAARRRRRAQGAGRGALEAAPRGSRASLRLPAPAALRAPRSLPAPPRAPRRSCTSAAASPAAHTPPGTIATFCPPPALPAPLPPPPPLVTSGLLPMSPAAE